MSKYITLMQRPIPEKEKHIGGMVPPLKKCLVDPEEIIAVWPSGDGGSVVSIRQGKESAFLLVVMEPTETVMAYIDQSPADAGKETT